MSIRFLMETAHAFHILVISSSHIAVISTRDTLWYSLHVGHACLAIPTHIVTLIIGPAWHHIKPPIGLANFFHVDLFIKLLINFYLFNSIDCTQIL